MEQTDKDLWQAYCAGELAAFEILFQRHKARVFNFALRLLGHRYDAEDITSEVFIQLFHKRFKDTGQASLGTWLLTVTRNACISRLRASKHMIAMWFKDNKGRDQEWDIPDSAGSSLEGMEQEEAAGLVRKAVLNLPMEQREALVLREYFQKDYNEIAGILECSLEKVKILIFRGRENLRKQLLPILKEDGS